MIDLKGTTSLLCISCPGGALYPYIHLESFATNGGGGIICGAAARSTPSPFVLYAPVDECVPIKAQCRYYVLASAVAAAGVYEL